jgi:hypothetical protein
MLIPPLFLDVIEPKRLTHHYNRPFSRLSVFLT